MKIFESFLAVQEQFVQSVSSFSVSAFGNMKTFSIVTLFFVLLCDLFFNRQLLSILEKRG